MKFEDAMMGIDQAARDYDDIDIQDCVTTMWLIIEDSGRADEARAIFARNYAMQAPGEGAERYRRAIKLITEDVQ